MQRTAFSSVVLVTIGLIGLIGLVVVQPNLFGWLLGDHLDHASQHFSGLDHRTHDLTFAFLFGTAFVGLLTQLRTPSENVAGQLMALVPWGGLLLAFTLSSFWDIGGGVVFPVVAATTFGGLTLIATILHPTQRDLFRSFGISRVKPVMLGLVVIAAVPLLSFAYQNIDLQATVTDSHSVLGHYGFMAAISFTIIGAGLLASLRPDGWWLPAWVAGGLLILLGVASQVYPDATSSLGLPWALAAIAWGIVFITLSELTQDAEVPTLLGSWGVSFRSERG